MAKAKKKEIKKIVPTKKAYTPRKIKESRRNLDQHLVRKLDSIYITLKEQNSVLCELNNRLVYHDETFPNCVSQWMSFIDRNHAQAKRSYEANEMLLEDIKQVHKKISLIVSAPIDRICAPTIDAKYTDSVEPVEIPLSNIPTPKQVETSDTEQRCKVDKLFEEHKSEEKKARGRPTVIDPVTKEAALELSNKGLTVASICEQLGLSMATAYRYINKNKRLKRKK